MSGKHHKRAERATNSARMKMILVIGVLVLTLVVIVVHGWTKAKNKTLTWDEFIALSPEEQEAFFLEFDTPEGFTQWMIDANESETVRSGELNLPWENGGKPPVEYLWEEFQNLSPLQQEMFFESFIIEDDFEEWMEKARNGEVIADETEPPTEIFEHSAFYTYEEFIGLSEDDQEIFVDSFETYESFQSWLKSVIPEDKVETVILPWEHGGKNPVEYTIEEFNQLTPEQQEAFFDSFDSPESFEKWLNNQSQ